MIYEFCCSTCKQHVEVTVSMFEYEHVKKAQICCNQQMQPVITGGIGAFLREPFEKGYKIAEHAVDEPVFCRDKSHLKDLCEATGTTSRFLEDDM